MTVDPVLLHACHAGLSLIFIVGGLYKLIDMNEFQSIVAGYRLVSEEMLVLVAWFIAMQEVLTGAILLADSWVLNDTLRLMSAVSAMLLIVLVTVAAVINLLRGHLDIECGCGWVGGKSRLNWFLPIRNIVLFGLAFVVASQVSAREIEWFDRLCIVFSALGIFLIYSTVNQLVANQPLLSTIKRTA